MATIRQRNGGWTVAIRKKNYPPQYATFDTKADAKAWAADVETKMRRRVFVDTSAAEQTTLRVIIEKYRDEISIGKKGVVQEQSKIRMICLHGIVDKTLAQITSADIAQYRDDRLSGYGEVKKVGSKTVREELNILGHVFKIAMIEWDINLPHGNPVADIRKPPANKGARDRRLKTDEEEAKSEQARLLVSAKKYPGMESAIILALETGMRRSELTGLLWSNVDFEQCIAHLPETKNGGKRDVPLSTLAMQTLFDLKESTGDNKTVLNLTSDYITHAFIKICKGANIKDLRWHDLRHEATSRFFEGRLSIMEVAAITGHKTLQMLMRYTHPKASELAEKLN